MSNFINSILTVILIFLLLVVAPLLISYMSTDMLTKQLVLVEVAQFINTVTDKAAITEADIDDIYLGVNSHGGMYDVTIERQVRVATENEDGTIKTLYYSADDMSSLNVGDVVRVEVKAIGVSNAKRLLWHVLRVDEGKSKFALAGTVR